MHNTARTIMMMVQMSGEAAKKIRAEEVMTPVAEDPRHRPKKRVRMVVGATSAVHSARMILAAEMVSFPPIRTAHLLFVGVGC